MHTHTQAHTQTRTHTHTRTCTHTHTHRRVTVYMHVNTGRCWKWYVYVFSWFSTEGTPFSHICISMKSEQTHKSSNTNFTWIQFSQPYNNNCTNTSQALPCFQILALVNVQTHYTWVFRYSLQLSSLLWCCSSYWNSPCLQVPLHLVCSDIRYCLQHYRDNALPLHPASFLLATTVSRLIILSLLWGSAKSNNNLTPPLPWCHLKTTTKSAKFETRKPFSFLFGTGVRKDFHQNA